MRVGCSLNGFHEIIKNYILRLVNHISLQPNQHHITHYFLVFPLNSQNDMNIGIGTNNG